MIDSFFIILCENQFEDNIQVSEHQALEGAIKRYYKYAFRINICCKIFSGCVSESLSDHPAWENFIFLKKNLESGKQTSKYKMHLFEITFEQDIKGLLFDYPKESFLNFSHYLIPREFFSFAEFCLISLSKITETIYFKSRIHDFTHAAANDLVNSPVGLLNVLCQNYGNIDSFNRLIEELDYEKIITLLTLLKSNLSQDRTLYQENRYITDKKIYIKCIINSTVMLIQKLKDMVFSHNLPEESYIYVRISTNLHKIFDFISKYR